MNSFKSRTIRNDILSANLRNVKNRVIRSFRWKVIEFLIDPLSLGAHKREMCGNMIPFMAIRLLTLPKIIFEWTSSLFYVNGESMINSAIRELSLSSIIYHRGKILRGWSERFTQSATRGEPIRPIPIFSHYIGNIFLLNINEITSKVRNSIWPNWDTFISIFLFLGSTSEFMVWISVSWSDWIRCLRSREIRGIVTVWLAIFVTGINNIHVPLHYKLWRPENIFWSLFSIWLFMSITTWSVYICRI